MADPGPEVALKLPDGEGTLQGLCKILEGDLNIRSHALQSGYLLRWTSAKTTGVINFKTMGPNYRVLEKVLTMWCPQVHYPKTIGKDDIREQAWIGKIQFIFLINVKWVVTPGFCFVNPCQIFDVDLWLSLIDFGPFRWSFSVLCFPCQKTLWHWNVIVSHSAVLSATW